MFVWASYDRTLLHIGCCNVDDKKMRPPAFFSVLIVLVVLDSLRSETSLFNRGDDSDTATTTTIIMQSDHLPRVVRSAL